MEYEERVQHQDLRHKLWGISWPGHPAGTASSSAEISLRDEPARWKCLRVTSDPAADYSYDDLALMLRDDGLYVLVETSGCSCPSPIETWGTVCEGSLADMVARCERDRNDWHGTFHGPWEEMYNHLLTMKEEPKKTRKRKS